MFSFHLIILEKAEVVPKAARKEAMCLWIETLFFYALAGKQVCTDICVWFWSFQDTVWLYIMKSCLVLKIEADRYTLVAWKLKFVSESSY